jgi:alpha-amylase/alpha-mannosidase (GH57 family)
VSPAFIGDYLNVHGAQGEVRVRTGAWNTGWHDGRDFTQWTGSERQKTALQALAEVSAAITELGRQAAEQGLAEDAAFQQELEQATWHLLRAETSCNFFWGEAWVSRSDADLAVSQEVLQRIRERLGHPAVD